MTRTEINFKRNEISEHNCELVMSYITQLIDDALNGNDIISDFAFTRLLGCVSGLELLGVISNEESENLTDMVLYELRDR